LNLSAQALSREFRAVVEDLRPTKASERFLGTGLLERSEKANARFHNVDNDPDGDWKQGELTGGGPDSHLTALYKIQSPFDGELHPPPENRCWAFERRRMREWLQAWGSTYVDRDLGDGRPRALVIKNNLSAG
jgi:adenine-specific DNA-methyltransferase